MSEFEGIKRWLEETADEPLEEMGSFFRKRIEGYEEHMSIWRASYQWMAKLIPGEAATLLDIGCGTGLELDEIFRFHPEIAVTGIDLEHSMLDRLLEKHKARKLKLIQGDYFKVPFGEECFDAAVSFETLHHFRPEEKLLVFQKLYACLKPGGCYLEADYIAESEEMEEYLFEECARRRQKSGISEEVFVHFDTPLTLEHEMALLRKAGFSKVECLEFPREEIEGMDAGEVRAEDQPSMIRAVK